MCVCVHVYVHVHMYVYLFYQFFESVYHRLTQALVVVQERGSDLGNKGQAGKLPWQQSDIKSIQMCHKPTTIVP